MTLNPTLLSMLACPSDDHAPLREDVLDGVETLVCTYCATRYPIQDGIPVLLVDDAVPGPNGVGAAAGAATLPAGVVVAAQPVPDDLAALAAEPVLDAPVLDEPVLDEPVLDEPVLDEPVLTEPVLAEPVLAEPIADEVIEDVVVEVAVVDDVVVDVAVVDVAVVEDIGAADVGAADIGAADVGATDVGAADVGAADVVVHDVVADLAVVPVLDEPADDVVAPALDTQAQDTQAEDPQAEDTPVSEELPAEQPAAGLLGVDTFAGRVPFDPRLSPKHAFPEVPGIEAEPPAEVATGAQDGLSEPEPASAEPHLDLDVDFAGPTAPPAGGVPVPNSPLRGARSRAAVLRERVQQRLAELEATRGPRGRRDG